MTRLSLGLAIVLISCIVVPASALDTVRLTKGTSINGTIGQTSPREIVIKLSNGSDQTIPVNEIESIKFSGEPPQLNVARSAVASGRFDEAQRALEKIAQDKKGIERPEVQQDVQYLQAACAARLALAGNGDLLNAGKLMRDFVHSYTNNYRFLDASELLGDIFVAIEKPELAQQQYDTVLRLAPSNDIKMRAAVSQGNAFLAQGKWEAAQNAFDEALRTGGKENSPAITNQKQLANLGRAVCLAAADKPEEGIKLVEEVLASADPEHADLCARAYNTLGTCLRKAGRTKDALLAYLHVDLLYPSEALAHAEALQNLIELWPEVGNPQRAAEAQDVLKSRYGNTRGAKG